MFKDYIGELLPFEVVALISHFLDSKSIRAATSSKPSWKELFINDCIWKDKIKDDFAIDSQILGQIPIPKELTPSLFFRKMHSRLSRLQQNLSYLPSYLQRYFDNKSKQHLILTACSDNLAHAQQTIHFAEYRSLTILAIYAGCKEIPIFFAEEVNIDDIFEVAASAGNIELFDALSPKQILPQWTCNAARSGKLNVLRYLLKHENFSEECLQYEEKDFSILNLAVESGNFDLVQFFLKLENEFKFQINQTTLNSAAQSGNYELFLYFIDKGLIPNLDTLKCAARSNNLDILLYLLDKKNNFDLHPCLTTLEYATSSDNSNIFFHLIDPKNEYGLIPTQEILDTAATMGRLDIVMHLLKPEFGLQATLKDTVHLAADSGNCELLNYLIHPDNPFGLKPCLSVLISGVYSENIEILKYLLDNKNKFGLYPDTDTLKSAIILKNIELVYFLLDCRNNFRIMPDKKNTFLGGVDAFVKEKSDDYRILTSLLLSDVHIKNGLEKLQTENFLKATVDFQLAYKYCPEHYLSYITDYILYDFEKTNINQTLNLSSSFFDVNTLKDYVQLLYNMGVDNLKQALSQKNQSNIQKALANFNKVIAFLPFDLGVHDSEANGLSALLVNAYIYRGEAHQTLGHYQKAIDDYTKVINLDQNKFLSRLKPLIEKCQSALAKLASSPQQLIGLLTAQSPIYNSSDSKNNYKKRKKDNKDETELDEQCSPLQKVKRI